MCCATAAPSFVAVLSSVRTSNTECVGMAWGGQLEKSAKSCIHISAKKLPCSFLFTAAHPVGSLLSLQQDDILMQREAWWHDNKWGMEVGSSACILNWWFVLATLGAPWMAWAAKRAPGMVGSAS